MGDPQPEPIEAFAELARNFIDFYREASYGLSELRLMRKSFDYLSKIQAAYTELPDVGVEHVAEDCFTIASWGAPKDLPSLDYWEVFDPRIVPNQASEDLVIVGSLGEDLMNIASDLQCGLSTYDSKVDRGTAKAVHYWRKSYKSRWGGSLFSAMRFIYYKLHRPEHDGLSMT